MTKAKTPEEKAAAKAAKVQPNADNIDIATGKESVVSDLKTKATNKKAKIVETPFVSHAGKSGRVKSISM
jgi:hypothetical protein